MYRYIGVLQKVFGHHHQPCDGFTLNGGAALESLAHFYGIKFPVPDPRLTVADYLSRRCYGQPRTGDRAVLDRRVELTVKDIDEGRIQTVRLRILGNGPERRGPWSVEGAHNFMRRASDHERDRWGNSANSLRFNELHRGAD